MIGLELSPTVLGPVRAWTPRQLIAAYPGTQWFVASPGTVFTDTAGTTPADFGDGVGGLRVPGGAVIATQATSGSRPKYGRHPAGGIRNRLPNSALDGAVAGVLGSGGSLPTRWSKFNMADADVEVLLVDTVDSLPRIRVRFNGTPTASFGINFSPATGGGAIAAAEGQQWTVSAWVQMVGGSTANINDTEIRAVDLNGSSQHAGGDFNATLGEFLRRTKTLTNTAGTTVTVPRIHFGWTSGAVDITLDIVAIQHERGNTATDVQITRADGFDITEAGQRSVYYLQPDGSDDWMEFAAAFAPAGAYTLAHAWQGFGIGWENNATFSRNNTLAFFAAGSSSTGGDTSFQTRVDTVSNRLDVSGLPSGLSRNVDLARAVDASTMAFWRNGQSYSATLTGNALPLLSGGFDRLFNRDPPEFSSGRFYAGALVPAAITEAERLALQRYLAGRAGFTAATLAGGDWEII